MLPVHSGNYGIVLDAYYQSQILHQNQRIAGSFFPGLIHRILDIVHIHSAEFYVPGLQPFPRMLGELKFTGQFLGQNLIKTTPRR